MAWSVFLIPFLLCRSLVGEPGTPPVAPAGHPTQHCSSPSQLEAPCDHISPGPLSGGYLDALGPPGGCPGDRGRGEPLGPVMSITHDPGRGRASASPQSHVVGHLSPSVIFACGFLAGWPLELHQCLPQGFFKLPNSSFINLFLFKPAQVDIGLHTLH